MKSITNSGSRRKILVIRLSSLGDVVLSTAFLGAVTKLDYEVHWVIKKEFSEVLASDRRIQKLWIYDKNSGFKGWLDLIENLKAENFTDVVDLHRSLRSKFLLLKFIWPLARKPRVFKLKKQRWKNWGYYIFKKLWPKTIRPSPYFKKVAKLSNQVLGQDIEAVPNLPEFGISASGSEFIPEFKQFQMESNRQGKIKMVSVMPGAQWPGKRLTKEKWLELFRQLSQLNYAVAVLGLRSDQDAVWLVNELGNQVWNGVGKLNLNQVAWILRQSHRLYSNDTGLVHLSEAIGVPVTVFFGPTQPDQGFGPWQKESRSISTHLWCSPCGKDGKSCFRYGKSRFLCQTQIDARP